MGTTAAIISAVSAVGGAAVSHQQSRSAQKTARRQTRIEQRTSEIETQRRTRRAIAARRQQEAMLMAGAEASGVGAGSGVAGAVGSLRTQTAANIGHARTMQGAQVAQQLVARRGMRQQHRLQTIGGHFQASGAVAGAIGSYRPSRPVQDPLKPIGPTFIPQRTGPANSAFMPDTNWRMS